MPSAHTILESSFIPVHLAEAGHCLPNPCILEVESDARPCTNAWPAMLGVCLFTVKGMAV